MVQISRADRPFLQAVSDGADRKTSVRLLAREALLLSRGNDLAITDQGCRGVMIEGGDAQNPNGHISNFSPDSAAAGLSSTDPDPMRRKRGDSVRIAGFPQKGNRHCDLSCGSAMLSEIDAA